MRSFSFLHGHYYGRMGKQGVRSPGSEEETQLSSCVSRGSQDECCSWVGGMGWGGSGVDDGEDKRGAGRVVLGIFLARPSFPMPRPAAHRRPSGFTRPSTETSLQTTQSDRRAGTGGGDHRRTTCAKNRKQAVRGALCTYDQNPKRQKQGKEQAYTTEKKQERKCVNHRMLEYLPLFDYFC